MYVCRPKNGEIDIMEMINGDGFTHGSYHWSDTVCGSDTMRSNFTLMPADWGTTFHEFAVEYTLDYIAWFLDGELFENVTASADNATMFDVPWYVILNTAVGGPWPKPPSPDTVWPTYHFIDYVRVAQPKASNNH
jgi:beta-glucanase (GH16 family)